MTAEERAQRLIELYAIKAKLDNEIAILEAHMSNEAAAVRRARIAAKAANISAPRNKKALCGTESGYAHHRRQGKGPACDACKLAHAAAEKRRVEARRLAQSDAEDIAS